jgi:hypothetical protein
MLVLQPVTFSNASRTLGQLIWLACSAAFAVAILDSIGESNRLAIADPVTDTLNLTPRDIITAITLLHGTVTGAEVDLLRLPLKKKLLSLADLPAHIVLFRGHFARLTTAGQAPLDLDAYRLFLASLSSFHVFHRYTLLFTVPNGAIGQQTFEAYAAYVLGQHTYILAHSTLRPFAGNIEGYEDGASEDVGMGGDLVYPTPPTHTHFYPQYPTANAMLPYYQQPQPSSHQFLPPPLLALGSTPTPTPWPMVSTHTPLPLHRHPQTRKATNSKARNKARKARHRLKRRRGPLTIPSLAPLCLALQNCTFIATTMAG